MVEFDMSLSFSLLFFYWQRRLLRKWWLTCLCLVLFPLSLCEDINVSNSEDLSSLHYMLTIPFASAVQYNRKVCLLICCLLFLYLCNLFLYYNNIIRFLNTNDQLIRSLHNNCLKRLMCNVYIYIFYLHCHLFVFNKFIFSLHDVTSHLQRI